VNLAWCCTGRGKRKAVENGEHDGKKKVRQERKEEVVIDLLDD